MLTLTLPAEDYVVIDGRRRATMRANLKRCIGMDARRLREAVFQPYQNCYVCRRPYARFDRLVRYGYAERTDGADGLVYYSLTREGLDWLGEQLGVEICDPR